MKWGKYVLSIYDIYQGVLISCLTADSLVDIATLYSRSYPAELRANHKLVVNEMD